MSAWADCINDLQSAVGRKLKDSEIEAIAEAVQVRMAKAQAEGLSARAAAAKVGKEITAEQAMEAMIKRRDAANNILIFADARARMEPGNEHKSEVALLSGTASGARSSANSIDANHHSLRAQILGPAIAEAGKTPGLLKALQHNDRGFNLDVARELFRRDSPDKIPGTGNKMAEKAAAVLGGILDTGRAMQNSAGAFIGRLENYMGRQYHDMMKVRGAGKEGDFAAWRDAIVPLLDRDKMSPGLTDAQFGEALRSTWTDLARGIHDHASDNEVMSGFKGSANLGKKVSQGRSLIFKDADSWFKYNEQFGKGSVMDAIMAGADGAARNTALMQKLGTNPEAMFQRIHTANVEAAKARGDFKMIDKLKNNSNEKLLKVVTGEASIPGNANIAQIGSNVRNLMQLKSLGGVLLSAFPDVIATSATLRANGIPLFEALGHQLRSIMPQGAGARQIAESLGAGIDGMTGHIVNRFRSDEGVPGAMTRAVNTFHKLNGLTYWTEAQKAGMGVALSHNLAQSAGKEFAALPAMLQVSLRRYGIEAGEWDIARSAALKAADGRHYLMPGDIADPAVAQKMQTYITDNIREGLNEPTARSRVLTTGGAQAGTFHGELMRSFMQFKSFTTTYMERHMGRVIYRGDSIDWPGAIYLAVGMTLAGYAGDQLYGLATNRMNDTPKDAAGWARVVGSAAARGGSLGLLGDAIFRDSATTPGDVIASLLGPVATTGAQVIAAGHAITSNAKSVSGKSTASVAEKQGFNLLKAQVPNLIYGKAAYEYLFGHALQEMVSPGATQRYNNLLRQQGQHQVLRPALQN
jgi:hypothetical protein